MSSFTERQTENSEVIIRSVAHLHLPTCRQISIHFLGMLQHPTLHKVCAFAASELKFQIILVYH